MSSRLRQPNEQEFRDLAMTLAGEIDLSKSPLTSPETRVEAANILATIVNRFSTDQPRRFGSSPIRNYSDYSDVVRNADQYNAWMDRHIDTTRQNYETNRTYWDRVVDDFFSGDLRPSFPNATHYHADHIQWRYSSDLERLGSAGPHIFYNDEAFMGRSLGQRRPSYEMAVFDAPSASWYGPAIPDGLEIPQHANVPNPVPHPDGPNASQEGGLSPDAATIRRRLDQGFDRMDQDLGPPVVDPRYEPILNRLTPEQMEGLRTELDEVRAQHRRQSDYDATMLQERMARSLQGLRESGRPDDDLDDAGILNTLGEERFADYARQRDGARRYHHAVAGMESLPDQEIEARMAALRSAKVEPGDEGAALQSDVVRHVQALRAERQTDPAMAVRRIPEMKRAESDLNPDDRESVSAFVGEGLRWQAVQELAPSAQRAVPRELAQTLADGILAQQADARRDGVRPAVAMRASIDGIRNVFGDAHARSVMNSAFAEMRGADHLASMARHMFDRDEMGGMMSSAVPQMMPPVAHGQGAGGPALKPIGRG